MDIVSDDIADEHLSNKEVRLLTPTIIRKRRTRRLHVLTRRWFFTILDKIVVEVLKGNRILLPNNIIMLIGRDKSTKYLSFSHNPQKYANVHTNGVQYGMLITGFVHNYHIKMSRKYRMELSKRLQNGQEY